MNEPKIIFEDDYIIVLNKPAGWITNDADTTTNQPVVQTWIRENLHFPISENRDLRSGIVHRIDKETSGILLVAKTEEGFAELQRQFKARVVEKTYLSLVHGKVDSKEGEISISVGRLPWRKDRFGIVPGGRESSTKYKVISYYSFPKAKDHLKDYSLVEFYPKTGRTHQIRIHSKYLGHPLVSDEFYTGRKTARADRKWCSRLFLHAQGITFKHPASGKGINFKTELSDDLVAALNILVKT